jgi:hypothetical protein
MRVIFNLTDAQRKALDEGVSFLKGSVKNPTVAYANAHGEYYAYDGKHGQLICGVGKCGAYVTFDGQAPHQYVGVPIAQLERE